MQMYRQGDVLIKQTKALPEDAKPAGHGVLAEGEATGHAHRLVGAELLKWTLPGGGSVTETALGFRVGEGGATVVHEEHSPISLPAGNFVVRRQREYRPEAIVRVAD